jgi:group I intron endonuclease
MKTELNCIYKITNDYTHKVYIGFANNSIQRWGKHIEHLQLNCHCNKPLTDLYEKYGLDSFNFEIIKSGLKEEDLIIEEKIVISEIGINNLLNMTNMLPERLAIVNHVNKKHKLVTVRYIIETYGLKVITKLQNKLYSQQFSIELTEQESLCREEFIDKVKNVNKEKPVYKIDKHTNTVLDTYTSVRKAAEQNEVSTMFVRNSLNGKSTFLAKDFYFTYDLENLILVKEQFKKVKAIFNIKDNRQELEFNGVRDCARHFETDPATIRRSARLKTTIKKGKMTGWKFEIEQ